MISPDDNHHLLRCVYFTLQIPLGALSRYKKTILIFDYSNSFGFRHLLLSTIATVAIAEIELYHKKCAFF